MQVYIEQEVLIFLFCLSYKNIDRIDNNNANKVICYIVKAQDKAAWNSEDEKEEGYQNKPLTRKFMGHEE